MLKLKSTQNLKLLKINPTKEKQKIINFIQTTFKREGFKKVVIGLSGGIDSTTCFYLLKEIFPSKNIFVALLDYFYQPDKTTNKILKHVKIPKQNIYQISIKKITDEIKKTLTIKETSKFADKLRVGNIMARVRMIILFDLAKRHQALVCGTENKTEYLLGYYTRFGDEASDIEPIRHLYKSQVIQLAKYLGVPKKIINQTPSAGLWPGQTDEGEFGFTYKEADQVLHLIHDQKLEVKKVIKMGYQNAKKILDLVKKNQFKKKVPYTIQ